MGESVQIAFEVYFLGFTISILIAALIKGMLIVIRHMSPKKKEAEIQETAQE